MTISADNSVIRGFGAKVHENGNGNVDRHSLHERNNEAPAREPELSKRKKCAPDNAVSEILIGHSRGFRPPVFLELVDGIDHTRLLVLPGVLDGSRPLAVADFMGRDQIIPARAV